MVCRKTCMALLRGRSRRRRRRDHTSAVSGDELAALDRADRRLEDPDAGFVEREVAEQTLILGRPDRVRETLTGGHVAALQCGEQDLRAVVSLRSVQFGYLVELRLVGGGELLRRPIDVVAEVRGADDGALGVLRTRRVE